MFRIFAAVVLAMLPVTCWADIIQDSDSFLYVPVRVDGDYKDYLKPIQIGSINTDTSRVTFGFHMPSQTITGSDVQTVTVPGDPPIPGIPEICDLNGCTPAVPGTPGTFITTNVPYSYSITVNPVTFLDITVPLSAVSQTGAEIPITIVKNLDPVTVHWELTGPTESKSGTLEFSSRGLKVQGPIILDRDILGPVTSWRLRYHPRLQLHENLFTDTVDGVAIRIALPEPSSFLCVGFALLAVPLKRWLKFAA